MFQYAHSIAPANALASGVLLPAVANVGAALLSGDDKANSGLGAQDVSYVREQTRCRWAGRIYTFAWQFDQLSVAVCTAGLKRGLLQNLETILLALNLLYVVSLGSEPRKPRSPDN